MVRSELRLRLESNRPKRRKPQMEEFDCKFCDDTVKRAEGSTRDYCNKGRCISEGRREAGRRGGAARFGGDIQLRNGTR